VVDSATRGSLASSVHSAAADSLRLWLVVSLAHLGLKEAPGALGSKDNPLIIEIAHEIVRRYPDLKGNVG
jgi:hypothetical protein